MKAFFAGLIVLGLQVLTLAAADQGEAKPIFEDKFNAKLAKDWSWLREDPKAWRINKDGLEIRALPGHGTARKNILLRPPCKAGEEFAVEVFVSLQPTVEFEHAGLQCYFDERNWVGLVTEKLGKSHIQLTQRKNDKANYQNTVYEGQTVWLRLVVSGGKAKGFYRATDKDQWKKVAECDLPTAGEFRFGLAAGGGPKDVEHWARFRDFRILPAAKMSRHHRNGDLRKSAGDDMHVDPTGDLRCPAA